MRIFHEALTFDSRTLISSDGTEIYADAVGDRSKPAVVFIHDLWMSCVVFDEIFNDRSWLSDVYLVRYDTRGHGRSGRPTDPDAWDSQRLADDFVTVVQAFQLDKPIVVGWGLGATVITDILSFYPASYLSGVVYITPVPSLGEIMDKTLTSVFRDCVPALTENVDLDIYQEAASTLISLFSASMSHSLQLACLGGFAIQPPYVARNLMSRTQDDKALMRAGKELRLPTLVILGKEDNFTVNEEIVDIFEDWADIDVVEMEADHMPWLRDPVIFRHEVLKWVKRVASREMESILFLFGV